MKNKTSDSPSLEPSQAKGWSDKERFEYLAYIESKGQFVRKYDYPTFRDAVDASIRFHIEANRPTEQLTGSCSCQFCQPSPSQANQSPSKEGEVGETKSHKASDSAEGSVIASEPCVHCGLATPNRVTVYYMHDNHTFTPLSGGLSAILQQARCLGKTSPYGMLCGPILCFNDKEVRRLSQNVHAGLELKDTTDWEIEIRNDPDALRLIEASTQSGAAALDASKGSPAPDEITETPLLPPTASDQREPLANHNDDTERLNWLEERCWEFSPERRDVNIKALGQLLFNSFESFADLRKAIDAAISEQVENRGVAGEKASSGLVESTESQPPLPASPQPLNTGAEAGLLPCPFCGLTGKDTVSPDMGLIPAVTMHSYPRGYRVECEGCRCNGPWHHQHVEAINSWNRRASSKPATERDGQK